MFLTMIPGHSKFHTVVTVKRISHSVSCGNRILMQGLPKGHQIISRKDLDLRHSYLLVIPGKPDAAQKARSRHAHQSAFLTRR